MKTARTEHAWEWDSHPAHRAEGLRGDGTGFSWDSIYFLFLFQSVRDPLPFSQSCAKVLEFQLVPRYWEGQSKSMSLVQLAPTEMPGTLRPSAGSPHRLNPALLSLSGAWVHRNVSATLRAH